MSRLKLAIQRATSADVAIALAWTPDCDDLRRWAGPSVRWPATPESLWADIYTPPDAMTFAMRSDQNDLVGFGQVMHREQRYGHLARIIVSPGCRGQGLGRTLCVALMREALRLHPRLEAFSLYVYSDNVRAISLYRSLGYLENGAHPKLDNIILMQAPLTAASVDDTVNLEDKIRIKPA